jgi:hypothetical protein
MTGNVNAQTATDSSDKSFNETDFKEKIIDVMARDIIDNWICNIYRGTAVYPVKVRFSDNKCNLVILGESGNSLFLGNVNMDDSCQPSSNQCQVEYQILCDFRGWANAQNCSDWQKDNGQKRIAIITFSNGNPEQALPQ